MAVAHAARPRRPELVTAMAGKVDGFGWHFPNRRIWEVSLKAPDRDAILARCAWDIDWVPGDPPEIPVWFDQRLRSEREAQAAFLAAGRTAVCTAIKTPDADKEGSFNARVLTGVFEVEPIGPTECGRGVRCRLLGRRMP